MIIYKNIIISFKFAEKVQLILTLQIVTLQPNARQAVGAKQGQKNNMKFLLKMDREMRIKSSKRNNIRDLRITAHSK